MYKHSVIEIAPLPKSCTVLEVEEQSFFRHLGVSRFGSTCMPMPIWSLTGVLSINFSLQHSSTSGDKCDNAISILMWAPSFLLIEVNNRRKT